MTVTDATQTPPARSLIGHLSEYQMLLDTLDQQPGLHALIADPFSGTSHMLRAAVAALSYPGLYIDARPLADELDLAMAIGDAAVHVLRPGAAAWWDGVAPETDKAARLVRRELAEISLDPVAVQEGEGPAADALGDALRLAVLLAGGTVAVAIDHLDDLLRHGRVGRSDPLATLRATRQQLPDLQLLLVGRPDGRLGEALHDPRHPLFQAGQSQRIPRTHADRYINDLATGRPELPEGISAATLGVAAELTAGVPAYVWAIIDRLAATPMPPAEAWQRYRDERLTEITRHAETIGALHPVALTVLAAVAAGLGAYALPINDGRVRAALQTLRSTGAVWQPRAREWAIADPLLASWLRHHAPAWIHRRARAATGSVVER